MPYIDVTVDIDLSEFDDDELIDEIESRGWLVSEEKGKEFLDLDLTNDELDYITDLVCNAKPGTLGYEIYQKVKKNPK
jgi:hypothetical protein